MSRPQSHDVRAALWVVEQLRRIADYLVLPISTLDDDTAQRVQEREYAADIVRALKRRHETEPGPAGKEDMERAARRGGLHGLLARLDRNTALTREESDRLRDLVNTEIREASTAREVARGNLRHVRVLVPEIDRLTNELEQAQAAIERVRALRQPFVMWRDIAAALDGAGQPTAPTTCTATIAREDQPNAPARCIAPAGHYDPTTEPTFTGPDRSPGGWHTDGRARAWTDRAASATPHREEPILRDEAVTPGNPVTTGTDEPASSPLRDHLAATLAEFADVDPYAMADAILPSILTTTGITAVLARMSEADVHRVTSLYERWVKAGPPPLGTSMARWWDARLVELRNAILPSDNQPGSPS
ncbi:hypothetical protein ACWEHT_11500 [Streptomyces sp. NPDC004646]